MKTREVMASIVFGCAVIAWSEFIPTVSVAAQQSPAPPAGDDHPEMPAGPGKDIALRVCTKCHAISNITAQRQDADGWTATITKMVGFGAVGTDDEFEAILDYLTKNYGPDSAPPAPAHAKIEVNKESAAQLAKDLGLTDKEAEAVVSYREKNGPFKSIDELKKVPDVDTKKIEAKREDLQFP